ncbi:MAG: SDR family NAD(P)-dependent oxidoreductase, partial [Actinobacteria bacterium]|nr:SDR family NAD(P)-dependent oxidoreductase [Actinomycetota bacterium]
MAPGPPSDPGFLSSLFSLQGRVALVTGGSSGIGRAMARALALAGAKVVLLARREEPLAETAGALRAEGCEAAWASADLADRAAV